MKVYNDELYHHGVKGMHWGVRKERTTSRLSRRKRIKNPEYVHAHNRRNKIKYMSNEDLQRANKRLQLEDNYKRSKSNNSLIKKGIRVVGTTSAVLGSIYAIKSNSQKVRDLVNDGAKVVQNISDAINLQIDF